MAYRTRIKYTAVQKAEMWDHWQRAAGLLQLMPSLPGEKDLEPGR